jgi:hypothetical protein
LRDFPQIALNVVSVVGGLMGYVHQLINCRKEPLLSNAEHTAL